jgi:LytR cell envelope-related transcriptional attenuator
LLVALALWAILIAAGSAIALAAGSSDSPSSSMTPGAAMPGTPSGGAAMSGAPTDGTMPSAPTDGGTSSSTAAPSATMPGAPMSGTPTAPVDANTLAPGQTAPATTQGDMQAAGDEGRDLDNLLGTEPPTRVRVAILNATGKTGGANKVAVLLGEYQRQVLEDQIGLQIEVVNLSNAENVRPGQSVIFYRPEFLRAALAMAKAIPGDQFVEPMRPAGLKRAGVDVEIVVGKELP